MVEDVAVEPIAVHEATAGLQHCVGLIGVTGGFLGGCDPAGVAWIIVRDDGIGIGRAEGLHLRHRPRGVAGLRRQTAADEMGDRDDGRIVGESLGGL